MDKIKKILASLAETRIFVWFKNLKIKHSFMACMVLFLVMFFAVFVASLEHADSVSDRVMSFYYGINEIPAGSETDYNISNKGITVTFENGSNRHLGSGLILYISSVYLVVFLILFTLCIVFAGITFYYLKLKKPLDILRNASEKISSNELDFNLKYERADEMGELIDSFEKMRSALYENNRKMWNTIDEENKVYAAFAHDVRTPLTVVHGYTDFLETYLPDGKISEEKLMSTLHTVNENLVRLQCFVDTMSAIRTLDELYVDIKETDFRELCTRFEEEAQIIASGNQCVFTRSTDSPEVLIDANTAEQVFGNLTANAVRYARKKIFFNFTNRNNVFSITVNDDGAGFSEEALHRASELFYHENSGDSSSHFGFGLYICKTLCEKHGGTLTLNNRNGGCVKATFSGSIDGVH